MSVCQMTRSDLLNLTISPKGKPGQRYHKVQKLLRDLKKKSRFDEYKSINMYVYDLFFFVFFFMIDVFFLCKDVRWQFREGSA